VLDTSRLLCVVAPVGGPRSIPEPLLPSPREITSSVSPPSLSNSASSAAGAANLVDDDSPLGVLIRAAAEVASGTSGTGREEEEEDDDDAGYGADVEDADRADDDDTLSEATGTCDAPHVVASQFPWLAGILAAAAVNNDTRAPKH
jgi:hypothetical protein